MNIFVFCVASVLGAGIWVSVLAGMGYWLGRNEQIVLQNLRWVTLILVAGCGLLVFFYWRKWQSRLRLTNQSSQ
jgi:membrane protein DedA with SNARE-associated domain